MARIKGPETIRALAYGGGGGSARAALVAHRSAFAALRPAGGAGIFASLFAMLFEPGTRVFVHITTANK